MTKQRRLIQAFLLHHSPSVSNIVSSPPFPCLPQFPRCFATGALPSHDLENSRNGKKKKKHPAVEDIRFRPHVQEEDAFLFTASQKHAETMWRPLFLTDPEPPVHVTRIRKTGLACAGWLDGRLTGWLANWPAG